MATKIQEWVSAHGAARILGVDTRNVKAALVAGRVRRKQLPGMMVQWHRLDIERLLAESITTEGEPPKRPRDLSMKNGRSGVSLPASPTARRRQPA